jgi:hypothetical protein
MLLGVQPRTLLPGKRLSLPVRKTLAPLAGLLAEMLIRQIGK